MLPVTFVSHGAPPLADDPLWCSQLSTWASEIPRPTDILVISAHWESAPPTLSSTTGAPLTYDFWGFPERYYNVTYPTPPAGELADSVAAALTDAGLVTRREESRGLDHGAYVPVKEMYPDADLPVLQLSMPTLAPQALFDLGRALAPLRDGGTLIVGSGFTTHNLGLLTWGPDPAASRPAWSVEFDEWAREAMAAKDVDALIDFWRAAPNAPVAHPRTEHFVPLLVTLGAAFAHGDPRITSTIDGFWHGLSKRSWQLD